MPFSGRATDSTGIFLGQPEDVSWLITNISPAETPLLSALGDAPKAATRVYHEWLEEELTPNLVVNSVGVGSVGAGGSSDILVKDGLGGFLMEGVILEISKPEGGGEKLRVTTVYGPNTVAVSRGFGGSAVNTIAADAVIRVIAEAHLEGREVSRDISRPRSRQGNYTQIISKDVLISGTEQAVLHIGVDSEMDHQIALRTREALRDLEKNVILQVWSGNTIGGSGSVRTMKGILSYIATNVNSYGSFTDANVDASVQAAWQNGGTDCDVFICGVGVKKGFDALNNSRVRVVNVENLYRNRISEYENTFGTFGVLLNRWMPSARAALVATSRIKVVPLQGRSFHYEQVAKLGDSIRGFLVGEYSLELRNEKGMAQFYFPGMSAVVTP
jgi:hypothetical protein